MPLVFDDPFSLAEDLRSRLLTHGLIAIDGWTGVGKTTLAKSLAVELKGSAYDVDIALTHDLKVYASAIRFNEVAEALAVSSKSLFVSGICLRAILAKLGLTATAHVYLKRMASWGWADQDELAGQSALEIPGASGEVLREELRQYHCKWQPHLIADYEFHRVG